jgi:hypothetical protein
VERAAAVVFLGPSLPLDRARQIIEADYRPPAAQGDVLAALEGRPRVVAIIDGYFASVPSVWHKEILFALSRQVHVVGGASMGALRAAELDAFGMIGVGAVYRAFASRTLTADDEVAVVHGPPEDGYRPLSEALVDLRARIAHAEETGAISAEIAGRLLRLARRTFYAERSLRRLLADARAEGIDGAVLASFERAAGRARGAKAEDAEAVLRLAAELVAAGEVGPSPAFALEPTVFFQRLRDEVAARASRPPGDLTRAVAEVLAEQELERLGTAIPLSQTRRNLDALRRTLGLLGAEQTLAWLEARGLTIEDLVAEANREAHLRAAADVHAGAVASALRRASHLGGPGGGPS